MGMKVYLEVEVNYPDLSMDKHLKMLEYVFKNNKVFGVKKVYRIDYNNDFSRKELIYPKRRTNERS